MCIYGVTAPSQEQGRANQLIQFKTALVTTSLIDDFTTCIEWVVGRAAETQSIPSEGLLAGLK